MGRTSFSHNESCMEQNTWPSLEEWVESDEKLNRKLNELHESEWSPEEQAREILRYLLERYNLPQTPFEIEDREAEGTGDSLYFPISMFEQIAQLRFVEPENNDPRYLVLNAAYLIKHKLVIELSEYLGKFSGENELKGLGYSGEDILEAELIPVKKGESWFDLGCTYFTKEVD